MNITQKSYISLFCLALVFILSYMLNFCNKITYCALVFIMIMFSVNFLYRLNSYRKIIVFLAGCVFFVYSILSGRNFYIHKIIVENLLDISLFSLVVSSYVNIYLVGILSYKRNVIAIFIASLVDAVIMSLFFLIKEHYSMDWILSQFFVDITYKSLYLLLLYPFYNWLLKSSLLNIEKNRPFSSIMINRIL